MGVALHSIQLYKILLDSVGHIVIADYGSSEDHFPHRKVRLMFILSVGEFTYSSMYTENVETV
jgi:hypothetical protein